MNINESNKWWAQEDNDVNYHHYMISKETKAFLTRAVASFLSKQFYGDRRYQKDFVKAFKKSPHLIEIFSPPRITKEAASQEGFRCGGAFDLTTGYDFTKETDRRFVIDIVREQQPALVMLSPPCKFYSALRNLSNYKRDPQVVESEMEEGDTLLNFAIQVAEIQMSAGRGFLFEHPLSATSWQRPRLRRLLQRAGVHHFPVAAYQGTRTGKKTHSADDECSALGQSSTTSVRRLSSASTAFGRTGGGCSAVYAAVLSCSATRTA